MPKRRFTSQLVATLLLLAVSSVAVLVFPSSTAQTATSTTISLTTILSILGIYTISDGTYYLTNPGGGITPNNDYYMLQFASSPPALANGTLVVATGIVTGSRVCTNGRCDDGVLTLSSIQIGSNWLQQTTTANVTTWIQPSCTLMSNGPSGWVTKSCVYLTPVPLQQLKTTASTMPPYFLICAAIVLILVALILPKKR